MAVSIWPNEAVSDANLAQHVYLLRRLLGDTARAHTHVLAVPREGYRFALPVQAASLTLDETFTADAADLGEIVSGGDFEAFRNYCQGSFFLAKRAAADLRRALEFFQRALDATPHYVPALIGLARAYALLGSYWHAPPSATFPDAARAIESALRIEPGNGVAHAVKSGLLCFGDWNWHGAREEIDLAIALNPGSALVLNNTAWLDICTGRYEDALERARSALALEPASLLQQLLIARALVHYGKYDRAIAIMANIVEADAAFSIARRYRAQAFLLSGDPRKALDDLERLPPTQGEDAGFRLPMLGRAYGDLGETSRAIQAYDALRQLAHTEYVAHWNLAIVAVGVGRNDDAMAHLESAHERHEATMPFLRSLRWFEPIARTERFTGLLREIGP